jgi:dienelactone hydrolase
MVIDEPADLSGYQKRRFAAAGLSCELFVSRGGREPVLLLHELPAITPQVAHLAGVIAGAGYRVYMPSLLGRPGAVPNLLDQAASALQACVRRDILALQKGDHTRGAVAGLRVIAETASQECGGAKVGVIGLCLTGGFALATAVNGVVAGAVAAEPSLPLKSPGDIDLSPTDQAALAQRVARGQLRAMLLRFQGDTISPCARVRRYGEALGDGLTSRCLPDSAADPAYKGSVRRHCVLTNELVEGPGSPTQAVRDELLAFLSWRLRDGPVPAPAAGVPHCLATGCAAARAGGPQGRGAAT